MTQHDVSGSARDRRSLIPYLDERVYRYFGVYGIKMIADRRSALLRIPGSEDFRWSTTKARNTVAVIASLACKYDMRPWDFRSLLVVGVV